MDPSIASAERNRLMGLLRSGIAENPIPKPNGAPALVRREEAARRLSLGLRRFDQICKDGLLEKRKLPNRKRASGVLESELNELITGGVR